MKILIDGVFFQIGKGGIARVWVSLLSEWIHSGFAKHVVVLDRGGTAPRIDGVKYRSIRLHSWDNVGDDAQHLQRVCDDEAADLFLSTYYTTPTRTPTVFMGHDMIPEVLGYDLDDRWWQQKRRAIQFAAGHVMVSGHSAADMLRFHPGLNRQRVLVAHNAADPIFRPCTPAEPDEFRRRYGIDREFVLVVGERSGWKGYKNGIVVFAALAQLAPSSRPLLLCVGGSADIEADCRALLPETDCRRIQLDDEGLRLAYGAALAYICPSLYEGFGLPIVEAMAVGCPVLTCRNSSISEVAGDAAIYFNPRDPSSLAKAIVEVRQPTRRAALVADGFEQAKTFDFARSAELVAEHCRQVISETKIGGGPAASQALEDVYRVLVERDEARARAASLEADLFDTRIQLSNASRFELSKPKRPERSLGAPTPPADIEGTMAVERRLAIAYTQLRRLTSGQVEQPQIWPEFSSGASSRSDVHSVGLSGQSYTDSDPRAVEATPAAGTAARVADELSARRLQAGIVAVSGMALEEGPFPEQLIVEPFRWQVEPRSTFELTCLQAGHYVIACNVSNLVPGQVVSMYLDDEWLGQAELSDYVFGIVFQITVPVRLVPGQRSLMVHASKCVSTLERDLYLAIYSADLYQANDFEHSSSTRDMESHRTVPLLREEDRSLSLV